MPAIEKYKTKTKGSNNTKVFSKLFNSLNYHINFELCFPPCRSLFILLFPIFIDSPSDTLFMTISLVFSAKFTKSPSFSKITVSMSPRCITSIACTQSELWKSISFSVFTELMRVITKFTGVMPGWVFFLIIVRLSYVAFFMTISYEIFTNVECRTFSSVYLKSIPLAVSPVSENTIFPWVSFPNVSCSSIS